MCRRVCPAITERVSHECHTDAIEYRRSGIDYARATDRNRRRRLCPRLYFLLGTAHSYSDNRTAKITRRVPMGISHDIAGIASPAAANNSVHGKIFITPREPGKRRSHNDTAGTCALSYGVGAEAIAVCVPADTINTGFYGFDKQIRARRVRVRFFIFENFCSYETLVGKNKTPGFTPSYNRNSTGPFHVLGCQ